MKIDRFINYFGLLMVCCWMGQSCLNRTPKGHSADLNSNEDHMFSMQIDTNGYNIFATKMGYSNPLIILGDEDGHPLDTFQMGDCRKFEVVKMSEIFLDVHLSIRSSKSKGVMVTRLTVKDNRLVPIYFYCTHVESTWDNFSKDSLLAVVSKSSTFYHDYIVHYNSMSLPNELSLIKLGFATEMDTLGRVIYADTSFQQRQLLYDKPTGVYMERYLTDVEKLNTKELFEYDSVPLLNGEFYSFGQWRTFPIF